MLLIINCINNGYRTEAPTTYLVQFNAKITPEQIKEVELKRLFHVVPNPTVEGLIADISSMYQAEAEIIRSGSMNDFPDHIYDVYEVTTL